MALDREGKFARSRIKLAERITPDGNSPAILVAEGGAPVAVNRDGHLYYGLGYSPSGEVLIGLTKASPNGHQENFAPKFAEEIEKLGVTGMACGSNGALYAACLTRIVKVNSDGSFATVAAVDMVEGCDPDAPTCFLRGLDVDQQGTVYVAACGCRCVLRVSPEGKVETFLKAERPWSPTGVAVHGDDIYVLEYTNASGHVSEGWLPRVRKVTPDGRVISLADLSADQQRLNETVRSHDETLANCGLAFFTRPIHQRATGRVKVAAATRDGMPSATTMPRIPMPGTRNLAIS